MFYIGQGGFGDSAVMEPARSRGVQFPFAVMDKVVIKVVYANWFEIICNSVFTFFLYNLNLHEK